MRRVEGFSPTSSSNRRQTCGWEVYWSQATQAQLDSTGASGRSSSGTQRPICAKDRIVVVLP